MLTDKQKRVLDAITSYMKMNGQAPTLEEIQSELGFKSKHSVVQFLEYLDKKGYISKGRGYRSIRLGERIVASQLAIPIRILWVANAGKPLVYADEDQDVGQIMVSKSILSGDERKYFCVRIQGTSMNQFEIRGKKVVDGSVVLVDSSDNSGSDSRSAYLCLVDGSATVKKIKKEGDMIYLLPESSDSIHSPIILSEWDNIEVKWRLVDVFNFS